MTTYTIYEQSVDDGLPVELYDIAYSGEVWRYTTNIENIEYEGNEYIAVAIQRGETEETSDATKSDMEITIGRDSTIGNLFKVTPPSEPITITIRQYHALLGYQGGTNKTITVWKGKVTNVAWRGDAMVLTAESIFSSLSRIGATRKFSRQCTHALYNGGCKVNRHNYEVIATPTSVVGTVLSVQHGKPINWFAGGYLKYRNAESGVMEYRQIIANTDNTITLNTVPLGFVAGSTEITMYAGCDHSHATCIDKFDNIENYGGQPFIPNKNPFGGSPIY
nr:MAG TPA: minor tail protein [Caudoviricetes sp.]